LLCKKKRQEPPVIEQRLATLLKTSKLKNIDDLLKILPGKENLNMELLFTAVYCVVSDFIKHMGGQQSLRNSNNDNPEFTDAEVISIVLVGQLAGADSQRSWYRHVRKNYIDLFPRLCSRTRFARREVRLHNLVCFFQQNLCSLLAASTSRELLIDSFPIEICNIQRLKNSSQPFEYDGADIGYCASKKQHYYGFKGHLVTDLRGIPIFICLTSASKSDLHSFEFVVEEMLRLRIVHGDTVCIGDKGYVGQEFQQYIHQSYGVRLLSMEREYKKAKYGRSPLNEFIQKIRKIIETTINLFSVEFKAGRTKRRTIKGLITSIMTKLAAFNLANFLNYLLDEPFLEVKSFVY
jgi:hypothetical protein